jgi:hypothetical protein
MGLAAAVPFAGMAVTLNNDYNHYEKKKTGSVPPSMKIV